LELDRRKIEHRISELRKELEALSTTRGTMRKKRERSGVQLVALVGYTNAGKSTVMNQLVNLYGEGEEKTVLEKDMLFATLDTSVRNIDPGDKRPFFLSDTVGFIHKLPHGLVKAFQSTLDEVRYADLLIQVVDYSDEHYKAHMEVTMETLRELEAGDIPQIVVYNKADKTALPDLPRRKDNQIHMAAKTGCGIKELVEMIQEHVYADQVDIELLIPYTKGAVVSYLCDNAQVKSQEYCENGIRMQVNCSKADANKYAEFCV
jgi:GTP-binding protein HflX